MPEQRWESDGRGHGVADARAHLPGIRELAELASTDGWVAEEPEVHLIPGLSERIEGSSLSLDSVTVGEDGALEARLSAPAELSRRLIRAGIWSILGGAAELTSFVRETASGDMIRFDVVTGIPPEEGGFATHGHTLRLVVSRRPM